MNARDRGLPNLGTAKDALVDIPFDVVRLEHGLRLDVFLSRRIQRMSRSLAARLIREGQVRVVSQPRPAKPSDRLLEGDCVVLRRKRLEEAPTDDVEIPVVFSDPVLVGVSKPGDLVVHPTASAYHRTLIRILRSRMGDDRLDLAHRIDKETSGLVVLGRGRRVSADLKAQFAERRVKKTYLALVRGVPERTEFVVDAPMRLAPDSRSGVMMEIGGEGASEARTECTVLAASDAAALVEARPLTGRQHQIRLHLAHAGHPIIGDKLYLGGEDIFLRALREDLSKEALVSTVGHHRHALHASSAAFRHPVTGAMLTLVAPLASDLRRLSLELGLDATRILDVTG